MKSTNLFFVSALSFLIANNLHYITSNGFIPRTLDIIGIIAFIIGLYKIFK